ncbi:MAG: hypothetical protein M3Y31_01295 [Gemmatimonadota bacterium]|nr:hypothetical protein [Gemmatimonadota bacterium]
MRRVRAVPALAAVLLTLGTVSACSDAVTGPMTSIESTSNTEGQGFGNVEGQGFGNVEGQGFGNVVADSTARSGEGQGFGN